MGARRENIGSAFSSGDGTEPACVKTVFAEAFLKLSVRLLVVVGQQGPEQPRLSSFQCLQKHLMCLLTVSLNV